MPRCLPWPWLNRWGGAALRPHQRTCSGMPVPCRAPTCSGDSTLAACSCTGEEWGEAAHIGDRPCAASTHLPEMRSCAGRADPDLQGAGHRHPGLQPHEQVGIPPRLELFAWGLRDQRLLRVQHCWRWSGHAKPCCCVPRPCCAPGWLVPTLCSPATSESPVWRAPPTTSTLPRARRSAERPL